MQFSGAFMKKRKGGNGARHFLVSLLHNTQICCINRSELTLLREKACTVDKLLLRDLADLEPVLVSQLPVKNLKVLLKPLHVVALGDGRHSLLIYPSQ